jgi:hypothetical protein
VATIPILDRSSTPAARYRSDLEKSSAAEQVPSADPRCAGPVRVRWRRWSVGLFGHLTITVPCNR